MRIDIFFWAILFHFVFVGVEKLLILHLFFGLSHWLYGSDFLLFFFFCFFFWLPSNSHVSALILWATHFCKFFRSFTFSIILLKKALEFTADVSVKEIQWFIICRLESCRPFKVPVGFYDLGHVLGWFLLEITVLRKEKEVSYLFSF